MKVPESPMVAEIFDRQAIFVEGPLHPGHLENWFLELRRREDCGASVLFSGQVRADRLSGKEVSGISYSAYPELASPLMEEFLTEAAFSAELKLIGVKQSVGFIKPGEISLFLMMAGAHRKALLDAQARMVEFLKYRFPVWKKECYTDGSHIWQK